MYHSRIPEQQLNYLVFLYKLHINPTTALRLTGFPDVSYQTLNTLWYRLNNIERIHRFSTLELMDLYLWKGDLNNDTCGAAAKTAMDQLSFGKRQAANSIELQR